MLFSKFIALAGAASAYSIPQNCTESSSSDGIATQYTVTGYPSGSTATSTMASTTTEATTTSSPTGPEPTQTGIAQNCNNFYQAVAGDYCQVIVDKYGTFQLADFYKWNPAVGPDCTRLLAGYYYCVGVPGIPITTPTSPPTTGPTPIQPGVISDCTEYYTAVAGDTCTEIAQSFGTFSVDEFISWNPAVKSDCSSLLAEYNYCVAIPGTPTTEPGSSSVKRSEAGPSPTQFGIAPNCTTHYKAQSGDTCFALANKFGSFSTAQFIKWNPAVEPDCSRLLAGYFYCIAVPRTTPANGGPQPQQPGIPKSCDEFYYVVPGDNCFNIQQSYNITARQFRRWNPSVNAACTNLFANYYSCVGVK